jgi:hypothetical protein
VTDKRYYNHQIVVLAMSEILFSKRYERYPDLTDLNDIRWSCGDAGCYKSVCGFSAMQEREKSRRGEL